jgi:hypothetical protein
MANTIEITIASITAFVLLAQLFKAGMEITRQPARIAIFLQLFLCLVRNGIIILQMVAPFSCGFLVPFGYVVYSMWIVVLDFVLLLRSRVFTDHPKILTAVTCVLWVVQCSILWYQVSTIRIQSAPGEACLFSANFGLSNYQVLVRTVIEVTLLIPFVVKAFECFKILRQSQQKKEAKKWFQMSINNIFVTVGIIGAELTASQISQVPSLVPWITVIFCITNLLEASLVLFLLDDLKRKMTNTGSNSSQMTKHDSEKA